MKSGLAGSGNVSKHMSLLLMQSGNDGQHALDKVTARTTLGTKAALAPQHDGTEGALGRIIGRFYPLLVDKGPQRRLVLEQRATQSSTLGVIT